MLAICRGAVPVLLKVSGVDGLVVYIRRVVKLKVVGEKDAIPPLPPFPASPMTCGELWALSVILIAAARVQPAEGVNVAVIVQFAPTATLLPQVLVSP